MDNFLGELKRRELFKVGLAYLIIGWFVVEVASEALPTFGAPEWILRALMISVAVGFPVVLAIAWVFELAAPKVQKAEPAEDAPAAGDGERIERSSIAVLPFDRFSDQAGDEYLTDGITEDLITTLSHSPYLFVTARNATEKYRGKAHDFAAIGKALKVHYVAEGSVRRLADGIRLNVQLIETESGTHVWAEKFDFNPEDSPGALDNAVRAAASALASKVFTAEVARALKADIESLDAWGLMHRAYFALDCPSKASTEEALEMMDKALKMSPRIAVPHSFKASLLAVRSLSLFSDDPEAELKLGKQLARQALALAPHADFSHNATGLIAVAEGRIDDAEPAFRQAREKAPNNPLAIRLLGMARIYNGAPEEGMALVEEAAKLAPRGSSTGFSETWLAIGHLLLGEHEKVLEAAGRAIEQMPDLAVVHIVKAAALERLGRTGEAMAEMKLARNVLSQYPLDEIQDRFRRYSMIGRNRDLFDPLFDALRANEAAIESGKADAV